MDWILDDENIKEAIKKVVSNKGAPGVDGMTVEAASTKRKSKASCAPVNTRWNQYEEYIFQNQMEEGKDRSEFPLRSIAS